LKLPFRASAGLLFLIVAFLAAAPARANSSFLGTLNAPGQVAGALHQTPAGFTGGQEWFFEFNLGQSFSVLAAVTPAPGLQTPDSIAWRLLAGQIDGDVVGPTFSDYGSYLYPSLAAGRYYLRTSAVTDQDSGFFNVQVTAVPEPSTWALLAAGLAGVVVAARRMRS
jgi:hypothetical protein